MSHHVEDGEFLRITAQILVLDERATAPSAITGFGVTYVKSSDSLLYFKDEAGNEYDLTAGASGAQDVFKTISCPAGTNPVADSSADTLTLLAGSSKVTITGDSSADSVTFDIAQGNIDHGSIGGLTDDDHSQYILVTGTRAFTGNVNVADNQFVIDTDVFFVDDTNDYIGMGSASSNTDNQLHIVMTATKDILIDGTTNPRQIDTGVMRFEQTPAIDNTRCITYNVDNNNRFDTHAVVVNLNANNLAAGEIASAYDLNIDSPSGTAGTVIAFEVSLSGEGTTTVEALHVDPRCDVIHHLSGAFIDVEKGWSFVDIGSTFTDRTTAFNATGNNVEIFSADNDVVYWGMAATFDKIQVDLTIDSSGAGIFPVFEFSDGSGGWNPFTPSDETQGLRQSGIISWVVSDLAGWATDSVNGTGSKYWIRITRTRNSLTTAPTERTLKVATTVTYSWDKDGAVTISSLNVSDGNITNVGDIALDTISSDAGTTITVVLGTDSGDNFIVGNNNAFVVSGETDNVGIGTTPQLSELSIMRGSVGNPSALAGALLYLGNEGDGDRKGLHIDIERSNTSTGSGATAGLYAFAMHIGTADLTSSSFGLIGGRYRCIKKVAGGTITSARAVTAQVNFTNAIATGKIVTAVDYYAEKIRARDSDIDYAYSFYSQAHDVDGGNSDFLNAYGMWLEKQTAGATSNAAIVLDGDCTAGASIAGLGAAIVFGDGQDAADYYDGTDRIIDPKLVGSGKLKVLGDVIIEGNFLSYNASGGQYIHLRNTTSGNDWVLKHDETKFHIQYETSSGNEVITFQSDGGVGIGTTTVPHGGVGTALLALEGTSSGAGGPHVQFTIPDDNYPLMQMAMINHDSIALVFDGYWNSDDGAWKSSDAGSNSRINKTSDTLNFDYDSGIAQGSNVLWNTGMQMDLTTGVVTFSAFSITPSSAPSTNYQVANKKYVDDNERVGYTYIVDVNGSGDYTTITAALSALGTTPGTIKVMPGTYSSETIPLLLYTGQYIIGSGFWSTIIKPASGVTGNGVIEFKATSGYYDNIGVSYLGINGEDTTNVIAGIYGETTVEFSCLTGTSALQGTCAAGEGVLVLARTINNVRVWNMKGRGISLRGEGNWILRDITLEQNRRTGLYLESNNWVGNGLHGLFDTVLCNANGRDNISGDNHGVYGYGVQGVMFRNVISMNNLGYNMKFKPYTSAGFFSSQLDIYGAILENGTDGELYIENNGAIGYKDVRITHCLLVPKSTKIGITVENIENSSVVGNNCQGGARFLFATSCERVTVIGNAMRAQTSSPIYINGGEYLTAMGNVDDGAIANQIEPAGTITNSSVAYNRVSSANKGFEISHFDSAGNFDGVIVYRRNASGIDIKRVSDSLHVTWA